MPSLPPTRRPARESSPDGWRQTGSRKLAEVVAEQIESDIARGGWAVGDVIGSEAELLAQYGVSRAGLREGIRIVEHHFIAAMRRGPGGGLVVTEPEIGPILRAVALQLNYQAINEVQLFEARAALEISCVHEAAQRITPASVERLESFLAGQETLDPDEFMGRSHEFHDLVADLTGNPALRLFVQILGRLTEEQSRPPTAEEVQAVRRAHTRIGQAVMTGDSEAATRRMRRHLVEVTNWLQTPAKKSRASPARRS